MFVRLSPVTLRHRLSTALLLTASSFCSRPVGVPLDPTLLFLLLPRRSTTVRAPGLRLPAEIGVVEPEVVGLVLHVAPRAPVGRREAHLVESPILHHLEIRILPVQLPIHPPLHHPIRVRPRRILHVDLD